MPYELPPVDTEYIAWVNSQLEPLDDDDLDAIADVLARIRLQAGQQDDR